MSDLLKSGVSLVCPFCKASLASRAKSFFCSPCQKDWPLADVIDLRVSTQGYWGVYEQQRLVEFNARCAQIGWRDALKEFFAQSDPTYYDYILDESRAHWHFMVPLSDEARILDVGCGWGTLSFALAKIYQDVAALDASYPQIEFIRRRCQEDGVKNILPVCGQATHLPFADETFDLVVLNGVLEWVPAISSQERPDVAQRQALREACRVLKKGGHLYLAIENRWAAINFLGFRDTHSGLRFAPLLPRWLAHVYSRLARKKDFREYTYTYGECHHLLKEAGFSCVQTYAPLPSYRRFYYLLPVDDAPRIKFFVNHLVHARNRMQSFFVALVRFLGLYRWVRYFVPDFSLIAKK